MPWQCIGVAFAITAGLDQGRVLLEHVILIPYLPVSNAISQCGPIAWVTLQIILQKCEDVCRFKNCRVWLQLIMAYHNVHACCSNGSDANDECQRVPLLRAFGVLGIRMLNATTQIAGNFTKQMQCMHSCVESAVHICMMIALMHVSDYGKEAYVQREGQGPP